MLISTRLASGLKDLIRGFHACTGDHGTIHRCGDMYRSGVHSTRQHAQRSSLFHAVCIGSAALVTVEDEQTANWTSKGKICPSSAEGTGFSGTFATDSRS